MAIHWQVKFRSLRTNELYTVNIYDANFSGTPVQLTGAAKPFTTQEDTSDDFFLALRTQSGYLRIIDTGKDNAGNTFNWRDFIPNTDTDRPVTLTDENDNILWQGYMQAQNFGATVFDMPQEREFPVQCMISVLSRLDVNQSLVNGSANFAKLLDFILSTLPTLSITKIIIQGGTDARTWLQKRFDWGLCYKMDEDGNIVASQNVQNILKSMCRYWGWTARIYCQTLYLMAPEDSNYIMILELTRSELATLANGVSAGTIRQGWSSIAITNQLASHDNQDSQVRGYNYAEVAASPGEIDENVILCYPDYISKLMHDDGYIPVIQDKLAYTPTRISFGCSLFDGIATQTKGSFNIMRTAYPESIKYRPVIRDREIYDTTVHVSLTTLKSHTFIGTNLTLKGTAFHNGGQVDSHNEHFDFGNHYIRMQIGIGLTRESAIWWNGNSWVQGQVSCYAMVGGTDGIIYTTNSKTPEDTSYIHKSIPVNNLTGYIYIHFMGTEDSFSETFSEYDYEIANFSAVISRPEDVWKFINPKRKNSYEYKAKNDNMIEQKWLDSLIFASDNYLIWGPGVVMNTDGTYFQGWDYEHHMPGTTKPEQYMVNRVVSFWSKSRRKLKADLRMDMLSSISPEEKINYENTILYPCSISHDWRDDKITIIAIEM